LQWVGGEKGEKKRPHFISQSRLGPIASDAERKKGGEKIFLFSNSLGKEERKEKGACSSTRSDAFLLTIEGGRVKKKEGEGDVFLPQLVWFGG